MSLENQVKAWADHIHNVQDVSEFMTNDVLDFNYVINSSAELMEVRLLVTFGGPNIWITLGYADATIEGHWGNDEVVTHATAPLELWDYLEETYSAVR